MQPRGEKVGFEDLIHGHLEKPDDDLPVAPDRALAPERKVLHGTPGLRPVERPRGHLDVPRLYRISTR